MPNTANFRRLVAGSTGQRKSILRNLVSSLIIHESITTTLAKAKAVQPYAERVITLERSLLERETRENGLLHIYTYLPFKPLNCLQNCYAHCFRDTPHLQFLSLCVPL